MAELDPTLQNGRVTMAILATKLDSLKEAVDKLAEDHEERLRCIEDYKFLWKGTQWAGLILGASVIALLWLLMTGQVTIVKVAETLIK